MSRSSDPPRPVAGIVTLSGVHGDGWTDPVREASEAVSAAMEKAKINTYYLVFETAEGRVLVGARGMHTRVMKIIQEGISGLEFEATRIVDEQRIAMKQHTERNDPCGS